MYGKACQLNVSHAAESRLSELCIGLLASWRHRVNTEGWRPSWLPKRGGKAEIYCNKSFLGLPCVRQKLSARPRSTTPCI